MHRFLPQKASSYTQVFFHLYFKELSEVTMLIEQDLR